MIENYLYSLSKRKKIFYALLLAWLLLSLFFVRINCFEIKNPFKWAAEEVADNITDEMFTAANESMSEAVGSFVGWFFSIATEPFVPDGETFKDNTTFTTEDGGETNLKDFLSYFVIFGGMFISTLIYGFSMIIYFFSGKITDSKDTPVSLTAKYAVAVMICYAHDSICDTLLKLIGDLYAQMTLFTFKMVRNSGEFAAIVTKGEGETNLKLLGAGLVLAKMAPGVTFIILLIEIILIWKLVKGFLKLFAELVSRYIVTMVFLYMFALFGGTIVSNNTSQIFKSYLRTLLSSFFLLIFNIFWFKGCFMLVYGAKDFDLVKYIFILELLALGLKFDGMLRSMGLGVATGGSRLATAIGGSGRNLANTLRNANATRKSGGKLLQAAGIATGNKKLFDAGTKVGAGIKELTEGKKLDDPSIMASKLGENGKKMKDSDLKDGQAGKMLLNAMKNPGNKEAQNAVRGLSENALRRGAKELAGKGINIKEAKFGQFKGDDGFTHSGIQIKGERMGTDGKQHEFSGIISDSDAFKSAQKVKGVGLDGNSNEIDTDSLGFCSTSELKDGETCPVTDVKDFAGQDFDDALKNAREGGCEFGDNAFIEKDGEDSNHLDAANVFDGNGEQLGTISGDEYIKASSMSEDAGNGKTIGDDIQDKIKASGKFDSVSNWEPVPGNAGQYSCTGTKDNTETKIYATDKGIDAHSRTNGNSDSFMYQKPGTNGYSVKYDINYGKTYDKSANNTSSNTSSQQTFNQPNTHTQPRSNKPKATKQNNGGNESRQKKGRNKK